MRFPVVASVFSLTISSLLPPAATDSLALIVPLLALFLLGPAFAAVLYHFAAEGRSGVRAAAYLFTLSIILGVFFGYHPPTIRELNLTVSRDGQEVIWITVPNHYQNSFPHSKVTYPLYWDQWTKIPIRAEIYKYNDGLAKIVRDVFENQRLVADVNISMSFRLFNTWFDMATVVHLNYSYTDMLQSASDEGGGGDEGGGAEAAIRRAARLADGIYANVPREKFLQQLDWIRDECDRVGRDPAELRIIHYSVMLPGESEHEATHRYTPHLWQMMWKYSDMEASTARPGPPPAAPARRPSPAGRSG